MQVTYVLVPATRNGLWVIWNTQCFLLGKVGICCEDFTKYIQLSTVCVGNVEFINPLKLYSEYMQHFFFKLCMYPTFCVHVFLTISTIHVPELHYSFGPSNEQ